jgi:hypothetical protein
MRLRPFWYADTYLGYRDADTGETLHLLMPVAYHDDFMRQPTGLLPTAQGWTARLTGTTETQDEVASGASGLGQLALSATNEVQLSGLDFGDSRQFVLNQKPVIECRFRFTVLPTGAVIAVLGLCGNHNAAVDTVAESIWLRVDGSGVLTVETDDTVHETSKVATGVTLVANQYCILRIECEDPTSIRFYLDGQRVASGTTFNMSQVLALALQPVLRIGKQAAAATVGTLQVDYLKAWQARA